MYHILAAISAYHSSAPDFASTDWTSILLLYDQLALIDRSPLVVLNRSIALSKVKGAEAAILELEKLKDISPMTHYHLYYSTLGEFYIEAGRFAEAKKVLETSLALSQLSAEQELLKKRIEGCIKNSA